MQRSERFQFIFYCVQLKKGTQPLKIKVSYLKNAGFYRIFYDNKIMKYSKSKEEEIVWNKILYKVIWNN